MSRNLPEFPNLEHLKKQAKVLLRELQQQNPEARLREAYHVIARDYGFASWPKLKAHVESLPRPTSPPVTVETSALRGGGGGSGGLFLRFTDKARRTIFFARCLAEEGNEVIAPEQLLEGLFRADSDLAGRLFPGRVQTLPATSAKDVDRLTASLAERIPQLLGQVAPGTTTTESFAVRADCASASGSWIKRRGKRIVWGTKESVRDIYYSAS